MQSVAQEPLKIGDFVMVRDDLKGYVPAQLRDIFASEVLVAMRAQDDMLVTVHRSRIARLAPQKYLH